jgi:hypothetical protein
MQSRFMNSTRVSCALVSVPLAVYIIMQSAPLMFSIGLRFWPTKSIEQRFLKPPHSLTHEVESFLRNRQLRSYSKTSQHFMEGEGSLPCSQEPSTGSYTKPDWSSSYHRILFLKSWGKRLYTTAALSLFLQDWTVLMLTNIEEPILVTSLDLNLIEYRCHQILLQLAHIFFRDLFLSITGRTKCTLLWYCHVSGLCVTTWWLMMGSGLDDWIYWHLFTIAVNYDSHN